jgi:hypothetical protein
LLVELNVLLGLVLAKRLRQHKPPETSRPETLPVWVTCEAICHSCPKVVSESTCFVKANRTTNTSAFNGAEVLDVVDRVTCATKVEVQDNGMRSVNLRFQVFGCHANNPTWCVNFDDVSDDLGDTWCSNFDLAAALDVSLAALAAALIIVNVDFVAHQRAAQHAILRRHGCHIAEVSEVNGLGVMTQRCRLQRK